jgi:phosphatidate cytidylyltransferase
MLRTRLWMGAALIALTVGVLAVDNRFAPWFPFLFMLVLGLALTGCHELLHLVSAIARPARWFCYAAVALLALTNWLPHVAMWLSTSPGLAWNLRPWEYIASCFALIVLGAFVVEMSRFDAPGESVKRIALTIWIAAYVGLLPSFLVQLRWLGGVDREEYGERATVALSMAIFVPKCCDIGAYFTGRLLGRHRMAPVLSPKKTWEGAAGGLALAACAAIALEKFAGVHPFHGNLLIAGTFGLTMGVVAMFGDLAESLIKRDCQQKDASHAVPGFGGVLDVVDSVVFAAPLAYWWLNV